MLISNLKNQYFNVLCKVDLRFSKYNAKALEWLWQNNIKKFNNRLCQSKRRLPFVQHYGNTISYKGDKYILLYPHQCIPSTYHNPLMFQKLRNNSMYHHSAYYKSFYLFFLSQISL